MNESAVFDQLVTLIKPFAKNQDALAAATMETSILADLKVNSARLVDIILAIEDAFDVQVSDDDADKVKTIGDGVRLILAKK